MAKRVKTIKQVDLEELQSEKRAKAITIQSMMERPGPHVGEIIIYGLVILLLTTGSYWRNRVWNSEIDLWTDCVKKSPNKDRPHYNLGFAFMSQGNYQVATDQYKEALHINPNYAEAHNNLGFAFMSQGKYDEAIPHLNEALRINPNLAIARKNLGIGLAHRGK